MSISTIGLICMKGRCSKIYKGTQAGIITSLIDLINENFREELGLEVKFDELETNKNSICLTTAVDSKVTEVETDVTGGSVTMYIRLCFIYRLLDKSGSGDKNLDIIDKLDNLFYFLREKADEIDFEDGKLERVKLEYGAKLDRTFQGGIKDFRNCFVIKFTRFH